MTGHETARGVIEIREETPEGVLRHWAATCTACGYEMGTTLGATPGYISERFIAEEVHAHIAYMVKEGR